MMIKVCGITTQEDADAAVNGGATAIGFNFFPRSPRYLDPEQAGRIRSVGVRRVGVFVNESPERIAEIARIAGLDIAQLHGEESLAAYPAVLPVWKAARVDETFNFASFEDLPVEALLLDGPAGELYGGTGKTFDWSRAVNTSKRIILAGGLDGSNVALAVSLAHPWGVDACSRIESSPGRKDHKKMYEFLKAAQAALAA
jgi:phosphoribosylanthranilate isomerase